MLQCNMGSGILPRLGGGAHYRSSTMWAYTDEEIDYLSLLGKFQEILAGTHSRDIQVPDTQTEPRGELASRALAMPADANPSGAVFGGWVMALMDAAGAMTATRLGDGRVVTVAVSNIAFLQPLKVGDTVCCYADVVRIGKTSIT